MNKPKNLLDNVYGITYSPYKNETRSVRDDPLED